MAPNTDDRSARFKKPSQARSQATYANILEASIQIIVERGIQGLNTNAVAERAGVNIGTVYHYFPDKKAILTELFRQDQMRRSAMVVEKLDEFPTAPDLKVLSAEIFERVRQLRHEYPTGVAMRRAFRSVPEIAVQDDFDTDQFVDYLAGKLRQRFESLGEERSRCASRLLVETTATVMDSMCATGPAAEGFYQEALSMITSYLESLEKG